MPAMASAPSPEMVFSPNWITAKTPMVMASAAPTPSQTQRSASRRSDLTRKATRIMTTMELPASRSPMSRLPKNCDEVLGPSAARVRTDSGRSAATVMACSFRSANLGLAIQS